MLNSWSLEIWDQEMKTLFVPIFLGGPMVPIHPAWGHMLVSSDKTCLAGNDSSIVDHVISAVRNHTNHAQGYGSVLLNFGKSIN